MPKVEIQEVSATSNTIRGEGGSGSTDGEGKIYVTKGEERPLGEEPDLSQEERLIAAAVDPDALIKELEEQLEEDRQLKALVDEYVKEGEAPERRDDGHLGSLLACSMTELRESSRMDANVGRTKAPPKGLNYMTIKGRKTVDLETNEVIETASFEDGYMKEEDVNIKKTRFTT